MYQRIVLATDGSDIALRATEHALQLARDAGARLHVLSVVDTRAFLAVYPGVPESAVPVYPGLLEQLRTAAQAAVDDVAARGASAGVKVDGEVLEGTPAGAIQAAVERVDADLVVLGTHGRTGFGALLLGSTAQAVLHRTKVPVLLVR